jgi:hypothetical protein
VKGEVIAKPGDEEADRPKCHCGWVLPATAFAFPLGAELIAANVVPATFIVLGCPTKGCKRSYRYYQNDPASAARARLDLADPVKN